MVEQKCLYVVCGSCLPPQSNPCQFDAAGGVGASAILLGDDAVNRDESRWLAWLVLGSSVGQYGMAFD